MKKIAVIGSINMDMTAAAERIPRPGETVSARTVRYLPGGKGANQAVAAARLGGDVTMFGCVGDDGFGRELVENLRANGVNADHVGTVSGESSGMAMIVVAENDNAITVIPGANGRVTTQYVDGVWDEIAKADIVLLQNEIPAETVRYAARRLRESGKTVIWNPAPAAADAQTLAAASYFTPNEHEARIVLGDEETPVETLIERFGGKLIVTLGGRGIGCCGADGTFLRIPAIRASVVDTTGAGDTMNGAFAFALAEGMDPLEALRFSNAAAGIATEREGAQAGMPTRAAVESRL